MSLLANDAYLQFTPDMRICRLLNGLWQLSGAHGPVNPATALPDMLDYHEAGFTTWDVADHYGPAEDFIGMYRWKLVEWQETAPTYYQAFTKWVPRPAPMTRELVEEAINTSRRRMAVETLDLLQFHWWDYGNGAYLDALKHLTDLRDEGKLRHVALTNFDTERLALIQSQGVRIVSNQVQFSIIDRRPEARMIPYCQQHNVWLLTYGTFCGGLLSERYLGADEPRGSALNTASLRKYKQMIDLWGGWALFQELLKVMRRIATKHGVSLANVAVRYVLDRPAVAGVIVGTRLGIAEHRAENARVFGFRLDTDDLRAIHGVTDQSRDLMQTIGDCGAEYR